MYPVATMCRLLGVSASGYYAWQGRAPSARTECDEALLERIREIHRISQGTYGAPRIHAELVDRGYAAGRERVTRLMRRAGLRGISRRKGARTTTRDARARAAPDLVERDFTTDAPDGLWVADITYIPTWAGFLFLAVVLDAFSDDEKLNYSWDAFRELIKHDRRYFFLREPEDQELFSPSALLRELEAWCRKFELISTVPANRPLYRGRRQKPGERLRTPGELGPPPREKATVANRMNPPGIVMFYGSDEPETALREVARTPECDADRYAVGKFRTLRETRILDLTDIPRIPSIFEPIRDTLEYDPRPPLIFLNYFAAELSMPIAGDRSVHVEYVPPQVVTEFVRTEFRHEGLPLDGIRYRSARHAGGDLAGAVRFSRESGGTEVGRRPVGLHGHGSLDRTRGLG